MKHNLPELSEMQLRQRGRTIKSRCFFQYLDRQLVETSFYGNNRRLKRNVGHTATYYKYVSRIRASNFYFGNHLHRLSHSNRSLPLLRWVDIQCHVVYSWLIFHLVSFLGAHTNFNVYPQQCREYVYRYPLLLSNRLVCNTICPFYTTPPPPLSICSQFYSNSPKPLVRVV